VALRRPGMLAEKYLAQAAPFDASLSVSGIGMRDDFSGVMRRVEKELFPARVEDSLANGLARLPALPRFPEGALDGARSDWLWRLFFRGYWPVVSMPLNKSRD